MERQPVGTVGRVLAAAIILAVGVLGTSTGAGAQSAPNKLIVRQFDGGSSSGGGRNAVEIVSTGGSQAPAVQVTENGQPVKLDATPTPLLGDRGIVFVVDSGKGMNDGNVLAAVRETIKAQIKAHPDLEYAVVQAGDDAVVRSELTREPVRLAGAVDAIGPTSGSDISQAVNLAGSMFTDRTRLQPNIVLVTADNDSDPTAAPLARSAVLANATWVQVAAYGGQGSQLADTQPFTDLAGVQGGAVEIQPDREKLQASIAGAVKAVADSQYKASWTSTVPAGEPLHVTVAVGDQSETIDVLAGRGIYRGYEQLHPQIAAAAFSLPLVDNPLVLGLALLLVLIGVAGAAYAVTTSLVRDNLSNVLQPYSDAYSMMEGDTEDTGSSVVAKSALLQKAVALTEQVAENQGMLTRAEGALERANLPLRAGEALFAYVLIVIAATVVPLVLTRNVVPALIFGALGAMVPLMVVSQIASRRRKSFMGQLPDMLSLLSGTLKAGYSLMQGVESVSQEVAEPMGLELRRVVTESRLGRPLEESLEGTADRMDSPDFAWAVMAIRIQREVGGNLAELLMTVSDTMVQRERLRRDVASLTAEGRVSAYMLAAMPPCLAGVMYVLNKAYVTTLFTDGLGIAMVILASISMVVGFLWMRKIITIEI